MIKPLKVLFKCELCDEEFEVEVDKNNYCWSYNQWILNLITKDDHVKCIRCRDKEEE